MAKPYVYINLSQTLAIGGAVALGIHYLNIQADAVGIQRTQFKDRVKEDVSKVAKVLVAPFNHML